MGKPTIWQPPAPQRSNLASTPGRHPYRTPLLWLAAFLLAAAPGRSAPAPPDWVLVDPSDEPGFWVVTWPSVPDADGYQIYLQIGAAEGDRAPDPVLAWWGYIEQQDGVIRVKIAGLMPRRCVFTRKEIQRCPQNRLS